MPRRRTILLSVFLFPLVLGQLDLTGCFPGTGGGGGGGGGTTFNLPPTVVLTADLTSGIAPLTVRFSSAGSTDDGLIISRVWDFDDGQTSRNISPTHTFQTTGEYNVTLTLTDDEGASATRSITIFVTEAPVAVISVDRTSAESAPAIFNFDASQSFDEDGEIVTYRWDFGDGSRELVPVVVHTFASPGTYRVRLTVTDDNGVTGTDDVIIEVGIPQPSISFRVPPEDVTNIAISPDAPLWVQAVWNVEPGVPRTLRAGLDGDRDPCDAQAAQYDPVTGDEIERFLGHNDVVNDVAIAPDGLRILTVSSDETVNLYSATTGLLATTYGGSAATVNAVEWAPDGELFVHGNADGTVLLRSRFTTAVVRSLVGHALSVNDVAFSPDGLTIATASDDSTGIVFDVETGDQIATLNGHDFAVTSVDISPTNPNLVLTGSVDVTARLWNAQTGGELVRFEPVFSGEDLVSGHANSITAVGFSPDGEQFVTGSDDRTVKLWSTAGGTEIRTFSGHTDRVTSVAFSPDGTRLISGSLDGTARIWDVETGELIRTLQPCIAGVSAVAYAADGSYVVVGVAARNDIQLDTVPAQGNDLNLAIPTALDLSVLQDDQFPAQYYLWTEIDTDRTTAARTYSSTRVSVVVPYTAAIEDFTPRIPLVNNAASVVLEPVTTRQVFDLGPLNEGDRLELSLLTLPGYAQKYSLDSDYSVLIVDDVGEMFAWYQSGFTLFTRNARLVIGHSSPNYYVVVDGGVGVDIAVDTGGTAFTRQQRVYLNFEGGTISVQNLPLQTLEKFTAANLAGFDATDTALMQAAIVQRVQDLYSPYNVQVTSSEVDAPQQPYQTIYFDSNESSLFVADRFWGIPSYLDPRNETLTGTAVITARELADSVGGLTPQEMGAAIGNAVAHHIGFMCGLRETTDAADIMTFDSAQVANAALIFKTAPLADSGDVTDPPGIQDAPQLLNELFGSAP